MKNAIIVQLNKILTSTLEYKEALQELSYSVLDGTIQIKLIEFAEVAYEESENLILLISDLGGDVNRYVRHKGQVAVGWVPMILPNPENTKEVLECIINAERKKEADYEQLHSHEDMSKENVNRLEKHRKEFEAYLRYFQSAFCSLENKEKYYNSKSILF